MNSKIIWIALGVVFLYFPAWDVSADTKKNISNPVSATYDSTVFESSQYRFTVRVPTSWKMNELAIPSGYKYVFYNGIEVFAVEIKNPSNFAIQVQKDIDKGRFNSEYKKQLKSIWESISVKENVDFATIKISNRNWLLERSLIKRSALDETNYNSLLIASGIFHERAYSLHFISGPEKTISASLERLDKAYRQYFESIIKSFWIY